MTEQRSFGTGPNPSEAVEVPQETSVPSTAPSVLDELRDEVSNEVDTPNVIKVVPMRPNVELIFSTNMEFDILRRFTRSATNMKTREQDTLKVAIAVISHLNVGIRIKGNDVHDESGSAMTIASREFRAMMGAANTQETIKRLFGKEGHIMTMGQELTEACGYGDDEASDPLEV